MRKEIYLALVERLQAANIGINHISLWNENVTNLEAESGYAFPAVFLEFAPIEWRQMAQGAKSATLEVQLHIVTESLCDPSAASIYQDEALYHLEVIEEVTSAVSGMQGQVFNAWQHIKTIPDHNHDRVQHDVEVFAFDVRQTKSSHGTPIGGVTPTISTKKATS